MPAVAAIEAMKLDAPVTLLAGDNGTGKSTLIEAFAQAIGFAAQGGELERPVSFRPSRAPVLDGALRAGAQRWNKPRNGYFLRAESFFNVAASSTAAASSPPTSRSTAAWSSTSSRTASRSSRSPRTASPAKASTSSTSPRPRCRSPARSRSSRSRAAAARRAVHHRDALAGPAGLPGRPHLRARRRGFSECEYDDLDAVRLTRGFLEDPERYLRAALGELVED